MMTLIMITTLVVFNSLAPGKFEWNFRYVIFKWILVIDGWGISCEIAPIWMSLDFTDDQSTLVQVMAWCQQTTSHYLSQCWPRSLSLCGITRPENMLLCNAICDIMHIYFIRKIYCGANDASIGFKSKFIIKSDESSKNLNVPNVLILLHQ